MVEEKSALERLVETLANRVELLEVQVRELSRHRHYRTPNNTHLTSRPRIKPEAEDANVDLQLKTPEQLQAQGKVKLSPITGEKTS